MSIKNRVALMTKSSQNKESIKLVRLAPYFGTFMFGGILILFSFTSPYFLTFGNLSNILLQSSIVGVASLGMVYVIIVGGDDVIQGGIDLSCAAFIGLTATVTAFFLSRGHSLVISVTLGILISVFGGICNGIGVVYGIRPLLMTLGMGAVVTSADLIFSNNRQILIENKFFEWLRDATYFGLGIAVYIYLFTFLILFSLFHGTSIGIRAYAVGGNSTAALISGIKTKKYIFNSYVISAVCASISGILILARLSSSTPRAGDIILLDVILASFMSVIFSRRFMPNLAGVFVSAIFIATLSNAFTLLNFPSYWTSGIKGVIILVIVATRSKRSWVK